jgi:hypothetical protein
MKSGPLRTRDIMHSMGSWLGHPTDLTKLKRWMKGLAPMTSAFPLRRFGPSADGGYLIPNDLDGVVACLSPGVSTECGFDIEIADLGIPVFMADASVDEPPVRHPNFRFTPHFVGSYTNETQITLDGLAESAPASGDLLLQMDIEGAEYVTMGAASEGLIKRFRIMVIEFHGLDQIFTDYGFDRIRSVFDRLQRYHQVVHIHPNNCKPPTIVRGVAVPPVMEFTFHRKDRCEFTKAYAVFPRMEEVDNVPSHPRVILSPDWLNS